MRKESISELMKINGIFIVVLEMWGTYWTRMYSSTKIVENLFGYEGMMYLLKLAYISILK